MSAAIHHRSVAVGLLKLWPLCREPDRTQVRVGSDGNALKLSAGKLIDPFELLKFYLADCFLETLMVSSFRFPHQTRREPGPRMKLLDFTVALTKLLFQLPLSASSSLLAFVRLFAVK